ncbi:hypothetical protein GCM10010193_52860 [Kitasatospora atroaurantiaca]|uniref:Anti-sigma regulatory factor (Ser/Thr protein kinase) n=1 Tax=Kitasatospora atroaurantiaca TaxID=285545 RepID=A0A561EXP2_9ACTN|nr:ATP-binding protein [Kitasatospora atroaurantiaca]TWE20347.1 anti-sigma regulatory factor (Ser/Thr protein kinase) [Kitasatospora atroaurantiaca]
MHTISEQPVRVPPAAQVREERPVCAPGHRLVRWVFPPAAAAVPEVRHLLRDVLRVWRVGPDVIDTLLLAVSELVSNAVTHAAPVTRRVRVAVGLDGVRVRLEVSDDHPFRPQVLVEAGEDAESGRGLFIIGRAVADADGDMCVLPLGLGKTIRVRVPAVA